jgi:rubrerythrin
MEDEHLKTFQAMRAELTSAEQQPLVFDPDGEAQMYLRVMADGHVFIVHNDPAELLAEKDKVEEVLNLAIGMEKDSIAFYVGLKEGVSRKVGKDKLDAIIREEMSHITILNKKLADLN